MIVDKQYSAQINYNVLIKTGDKDAKPKRIGQCKRFDCVGFKRRGCGF
jgi:hypothetical protein